MLNLTNKQNQEISIPLLVNEEKRYETANLNGVIKSKNNKVVVTNTRLLIFSNGGYKSFFYDKIVSINVRHKRRSDIVEISLLSGKEPEAVKVSRLGALGLVSTISAITSLSNDSRLAYAIGSIEAQKALKEQEKTVVQDLGMQMVQYQKNTEEGTKIKHENPGIYEYPADVESAKNEIVKIETKDNSGKKLDLSFNFVPKVGKRIYDAASSEAFYTLTNGVYSRSNRIIAELYGTAKDAASSAIKATLTATMLNTVKQLKHYPSVANASYENAHALRCVAINNMMQAIPLDDGDSSAYINMLSYFADIAVEEYTKNIFHELGVRLTNKAFESQITEAQTIREEDVHGITSITNPLLRKGTTVAKSETPLDNTKAYVNPTKAKNVDESFIIFKVRGMQKRYGNKVQNNRIESEA